MTEWTILWESRDIILSGLWITLWIFALSTLGAFLIGGLIVYGMEGGGALAAALRGYVNAMRALPFLVLAYLLYYGLPQLGLRMSAVTAGLLAMTIYHGAYFAEILRGARLVLPPGTVEAAKAYGFLPHKTFLRIISPQLLLRTRPMIGNQLIYALKDTSFLAIITVQELTAAANALQAQYFIPTEAFVVVIALYWAITVCLELAVKKAGALGIKRGFENV
ncbi:amino acid ABC transporter permease [Aureimonas pseudogalii]|uniref:Polar amino acid transport system permease protein n=1 Tax=Aureimonas pseudogalii TaxID=1744844 RepID=A0A7W6H5S4_9HYPH|nr:amino acid ABC transporter permease [Aureimonas pseudogalii]MBB3999051.1 polar amino acid transport system permease protein [Aureimonas pseudogalii]